MYDLPPRRRISLILVKLGPAHCSLATRVRVAARVAAAAASSAAHSAHCCRPRAGVGKSSILVRFADDSFTQSFIATIGYAALTWYSSPARPLAAPDDPLLVTGQQGSPFPACPSLRADSFPGLEMRARGAQAKKVPS